MGSSERCGEQRWLQSEFDKAGKRPSGGLQLETAWVDVTEFADSEEALMVDSWEQQLCGA